jgi:hypothetical protein
LLGEDRGTVRFQKLGKIVNRKTIYEDGAYLEKHPTWHEEDSPWKAEQISRIMKMNNLVPSTICEIGCGAGEILNCLANEYSETVLCGYDISPHAIALCKKKEKQNLRFFLEDMLEGTEHTFDVALAVDVFEHVEDYLGFLRKLKPKAKFKIFHIPLDLSVQTILRRTPIASARQDLGHIHYFTKDIALAALKDTGYEIIDYFYTGSALELPNRPWTAKLMALPRRLFFLMHQDAAVRILGGYSLMVLSK